MKLIIAEKPDQGAKLAAPFPSKKQQGSIEIKPCATFPRGAFVTWAVGHLCELRPPEHYHQKWKAWKLDTLPILPETFEFQVSKGKYKQFQVVKKLIGNPAVSEIIMAGDAGREGELIVRLIIEQCKSTKPLKRLWLSSLTKQAVEEGFQHLKSEQETRPLYYEALSRACADWMIGMNASRAYTLLLGEKGINDVFSTGRVQTPTLALIVKREKEIKAFKSEPFWEVKATFQMEEKIYEGTWHKKGETRVQSAKQAQQIAQFCEGKSAAVTAIKEEKKRYQPPYLYNLSSLQAMANKRYKFSPKKTLDVAQKLYVKGYISYPRTDSSFITKGEADTFSTILSKLAQFKEYQAYFPLPIKSLKANRRYVNDQKVSDHYAIIPTEQVPNVEKLTGEERKIYDLIVRSLLAAHEQEAIISHSHIETTVEDRATFQSKGKQMLQEGWRKVIYNESKNNQDVLLPPLSNGEEGTVVKSIVKESMTQPPKRYTEGQLITVMKAAGKSIEDKELEKVLMEAQGLGTEATRAGIISILKDRGYMIVEKNIVSPTPKGCLLIEALGSSILASPEMTAKWEQRLSEIGEGVASSQAFMEQAKKLSIHLIDEAASQSKNWDFTQFDTSSIQRRPFKQRSKGTKKVVGTCRLCKGEIVDRGTFYGCSNYKAKKCAFTLSKTLLGKRMTEPIIKSLLEKGKTNSIKGFKKGEQSFDAVLTITNEGKINFEK
ncbi:DNA topoisomerase III [Alkalihalophilus lindianensis]|uniref:DNA topoisomerase n=1 Tax=Alkalihalophilus lindianensis TaxID=1630542 RepID=A0ABU3XAX5_9BACI|nr:DNA topoisomerase III [Alkalihalophilus lindianensis]MDV2685046.1 DNA topoisomerase III [Alkalihalophilus lindianensis]